MKRLLVFVCAMSLALGSAHVASALPIVFDIDVNGSTVSIDQSGWGSVSYNIDTTQLETDGQFTLNDNESYSFDFFTLTVHPGGCLGGIGEATVEATLALTGPIDVDVSGTGSGSWFNLFGVFSGGKLTWDSSLPTVVTLPDGDYFDVDFSDICALGFGNSATVQATITAHGVSNVPEPATMFLLGTGLVGLVAFRRKFKK